MNSEVCSRFFVNIFELAGTVLKPSSNKSEIVSFIGVKYAYSTAVYSRERNCPTYFFDMKYMKTKLKHKTLQVTIIIAITDLFRSVVLSADMSVVVTAAG